MPITLKQALERLAQLSDRPDWIALRGILTLLGLPQDRQLIRNLLKPIPPHQKRNDLRVGSLRKESGIHRDALPLLGDTLTQYPEYFAPEPSSEATPGQQELPLAPPKPIPLPVQRAQRMPSPFGWIVERLGGKEYFKEHPGEQEILRQIRKEKAFQMGPKLDLKYVDLTKIAGQLNKAGLRYRGETWSPSLINEAEEQDYSFRLKHKLPQPKEESWKSR